MTHNIWHRRPVISLPITSAHVMLCSRTSTSCGNCRNSSTASHDFIGVRLTFNDLRHGKSALAESTNPPAAPCSFPSAVLLVNSDSGLDIITRLSRRGNARPRRWTSDHWVTAFELKKKLLTDGKVLVAGNSTLLYSLRLRCSSRSLSQIMQTGK